MDSLYDALIKRMQNVNQERAFSASMVVELANRVLPADLRAKTYKNETLTLETASSAQAYFYKQDQESLLEQINAALDQPIIKMLRIRIKHT